SRDEPRTRAITRRCSVMRMPLLMQASSTEEGLETLTLVSFEIAGPILVAAKSRGNEAAIIRDRAAERARKPRLPAADNSPCASQPREIPLWHKGEGRGDCPRRLRGKFSRFPAPRHAKDDAAKARRQGRARAPRGRPPRSGFRLRRPRSATSKNRRPARGRRFRARYAKGRTDRRAIAPSRFRSSRPETNARAASRALPHRAAALPEWRARNAGRTLRKIPSSLRDARARGRLRVGKLQIQGLRRRLRGIGDRADPRHPLDVGRRALLDQDGLR